MTDKRHRIAPVKERLGDIWYDVVASFDDEHSAVKWLTAPNRFLDAAQPLGLIQGDTGERERVMAILQRMDGIRIG